MSTVENDADLMWQRASNILRDNDRGTYSVPTHGLYPVQFNWDSAFAALGYIHLDEDRAWVELFQLMNTQWPDGMIPHIVFWGDYAGYFPGPDIWDTGQFVHTSGITQPPVLASIVKLLDERKACPNVNAMYDLLRRCVRWHLWFMKARLDPETQAILLIHPWESGRDNLNDWDVGLERVEIANLPPYKRRDLEHVDADQRPTKQQYDRYLTIVKYGREHHWDQQLMGQSSPFRMVDPSMTAILLRANRDLQSLLQRYGMNQEAALLDEPIATLEQGWRNLWNPKVKAYTAYDPVDKRPLDSVSAASFLHAYAGVMDENHHSHTMDHLRRMEKRVKYMIPSFDPEDANFDADRYWRGPVWHIVNHMVETGLRDYGEQQAAQRIRQDTLSLTETTGFFEYFNPLNGKGLGGDNFTWTAAVYMEMARSLGAND